MARVTTKDKVLSILNEHRGTFYSGEQLAKEICVTRAAVWKAINQLREEGFMIEGSTNLGYTLSSDTDILDKNAILALFSDRANAFYKLTTLKSTGSTNDDIKAIADSTEGEGTVYVAETQTAGKGRKGRSFYSPSASGLYLSILLRPALSINDAILITTAASVAGAKAVEAVNNELSENDVKIKWVNDLYLNQRKICGILTEGSISMESGGLSYAVMGIGFNLTPPKSGWPEDIEGKAGSIFKSKMPSGTRNRLTASFLNEFLEIYKKLPDVSYLDEYRKRQLAIDRDVEIISGESIRKAHVISVNDRCELVVRFNGEANLTTLNSGEISIKL